MNNDPNETNYDKKYCYPGTDVLKNKLNITDPAALHNAERSITAVCSAKLLKKPLPKTFNFATLKSIHKALFDPIYPWAGQTRDVRIAKTSLFCNPQFIDQSAEDIFTNLKYENYLQGLDKDTFVDRLSYYMGEINALHPFREGNGRTQRIFCQQLAEAAGYELSFEQMNKEQLLQADIEAMRFNYDPLKSLLHNNIAPLQKPSIKKQIETIKSQTDPEPVKKSPKKEQTR